MAGSRIGGSRHEKPSPRVSLFDRFVILPACLGTANLTNELLYLPARTKASAVRGYVVFFPGDVQDLHHRMLAAGYVEWSQYSLERSAEILAAKFPGRGVIVVSSAKHVDGGLASYDNFARTDRAAGGAISQCQVVVCLDLASPDDRLNKISLIISTTCCKIESDSEERVKSDLTTGSACLHLEALLETAAHRIASAAAETGDGATNLDGATLDMSLPLTVVGFSKGAVVLNQMVTELAGESQQAFSRSRRNAFVESYRECPPRKRPSPSVSCNACGSGSPENECRCIRGQDDRLYDWRWCYDHEEMMRGGNVRPKKEPRLEGDFVSGSQEAHQDQGGSQLVESSSCTSLSLSSSLGTSSSTSLDSTTDEPQAGQDSDRELKCWEKGQEENSGHLNCGNITTSKSVDERQHAAHLHRDQADERALRKFDMTLARNMSLEGGEQGANTAEVSVAAGGGEEGTAAARRLFERITAVHWIDGGNGDLAGSFPDNSAALVSLASRQGLAVRVHGTPYQWGNPCRPWLALEKDKFLTSLEAFRDVLDGRNACCCVGSGGGVSCLCGDERGHSGMGILAARSAGGGNDNDLDLDKRDLAKSFLYFENQGPSLDRHFQLLTEFSPE